MTTQSTTLTELDINVDVTGDERILKLAVWWDPEDDTIEAASLRPDGCDTDEALPLEILWLMVDSEDLLDALHYENAMNPIELDS